MAVARGRQNRSMKAAVVGLLLALCSFTADLRDKNANQFFATLNGEVYQLRSKPFFTKAETNAASLGATTTTVLKLNFPGPAYNLRNDKQFTENLQLLIGCNEGVIDTNYFATLLYQGEYYYLLRDSSKLEVTRFSYLTPQNLIISAQLQGVMRNYNYRLNGKKDIRVKAAMLDLLLNNSTSDFLISSTGY